jgi:membrane protease subunit (stomatin/prohibitin family)
MPLMGFRARRLVGAAVVGGAAYHMGKSSAQAQAHEQEQDTQIQQMQAQQQAAQPTYAAPAPAAASGTDVTDELQKLAQLHQSGALSDAEFAAAKQKLLGV